MSGKRSSSLPVSPSLLLVVAVGGLLAAALALVLLFRDDRVEPAAEAVRVVPGISATAPAAATEAPALQELGQFVAGKEAARLSSSSRAPTAVHVQSTKLIAPGRAEVTYEAVTPTGEEGQEITVWTADVTFGKGNVSTGRRQDGGQNPIVYQPRKLPPVNPQPPTPEWPSET